MMFFDKNFCLVFLHLLVSASASSTTRGNGGGNNNNDDDIIVNVAIIGGGVSGITTAMNLELGGATDWIVLEAKTRLGGRVKTAEFAGKAVELGANWIQGIQRNPFYEACIRYGIRNDPVNYNLGTVVYNGGEQMGEPDIPWNEFEISWACLQDIGDSLNEVYLATSTAEVEAQTAREVFAECSWSPQGEPVASAVEWFDIDFEFGRAADQISIYAFPEYTFVDFQDDEHLVTDEEGMQKFLDGLLSEFLPNGGADPRVHLNTPVTSIYQTVAESNCLSKGLVAGCVEVRLGSGGRARKVYANHVVSTIPFGSLKAYHTTLFPQGFPGTSVLDKFQMANYHKTYLKFEDSDVKFFDDAEFILSAKEGAPTIVFQPKDTSHPNRFTPGSNVIQAVRPGDDGDLAETMSEEDIVAMHLDRLREIYGADNVAPLVDSLVTNWKNDPYTHGTWFQYGPRATPVDYDLLKEPAGNVIFSGEHSCGRFYGFVHGAMLAGARDGQLLLEKLGLPFDEETRCEQPPANQGKKDMPQSKYYQRGGGNNRFI